MSIRVDSSSLITGAVVVGVPGLGVLAESVPSTGEHGPGIASTWLGPAEAGKEVRVLITQWPEVGSLFVWEDTSFEYNGPGGTAYAQLYVEGQPVGAPQPVALVVGAGATYNDAISESTTLADAAATTNMLTALLAETVSLLDQLNTGNVFNETHAAAVTPADSLASNATFSAALAESATPADATTAAATFAVSLAEVVTLLDASSNGSLYTEVLTASVALSDALTSTATLTGVVTESIALSDALNALATFQATLSEAVAAGDFVATQADQATLPRKVLTARITALSFAARVQATSLSARLQ